MERDRILGGNPAAVLLRLVVLSTIVGIVLSALGIGPENLVERLSSIVRHLYNLGWGAVRSLLDYFLLGALVVVPIWIAARLFGLLGKRSDERRR